MEQHWHFYCDDADAARRARVWTPDETPQEFASGFGHNILELYARFRDRGLPVSVGPVIPAASTLVLGFASDFVGLRSAYEICRYRSAMIRSDTAVAFEAAFTPTSIVVPNRTRYWAERYGDRAVYLPALPQRGLIRRSADRRDFSHVVLKCNPEHIPAFLLEPVVVSQLEALGFHLELDAPAHTNGSDQRWHDFGDADITLCLRGSMADGADVRKPPTKLINAWNANTLPVIASESAYIEIAVPGEDCLLLRSPDMLVDTLRELRDDPDRGERMLRAVAQRADEYSPDSILESWAHYCEAVAGAPPSKWRVLSSRAQIVWTKIRRMAGR